MNRRPRRNHSPAFKAKVALAALKGDRVHGLPANRRLLRLPRRQFQRIPKIEQRGAIRYPSPSLTGHDLPAPPSD
jgi:hypothetical protein